MPETTVYKDNRPVFGQDDVRGPGKTAIVNMVPKAIIPESLTKNNLCFGVYGMDCTHVAMALCWSKVVGHLRLILLQKYLI